MIKRLKYNSEFADNQIQIGFKNAKRFSWDKCYQETKQVYKQLCEEYY